MGSEDTMLNKQSAKLWIAISRSLGNVEQGRSAAEFVRYETDNAKIIIAIARFRKEDYEDENDEEEDEH